MSCQVLYSVVTIVTDFVVTIVTTEGGVLA